MTDEELAVEQDEAPEGADDGLEEEELSEEAKLLAKLKETISVTKEEIGPLHLKMTIEVPRETLQERMGEQFQDLRRDANVPGFRKGRAPMVLIEKRFGSEVGDQLVTQMVSSGYLAATEKEDLNPLGDPLIWCKVREERESEDGTSKMVESEKLVPIDEAIRVLKIPKEGPFTFSCEIELTPEFDLPELTKIPIKRPAVSISDDDVKEEMRKMRAMQGSYQPIEDGQSEPDDLLYAEMKMIVDGEVIEQEDSFDVPVRDTAIKGVRLEGFGEVASGKKCGEEFTFSATVPEEHVRIDMRGKTAEFRFKIQEIKRLVIPDFDEATLSAMGFESEADLADMIKSTMESELAAALQSGMRSQIAKHLLDTTELELPDGVSQRTTERMVARRMMDMVYRQNMAPADIEKAMDAMRAEAREDATNELRLLFILEKIAEDRDIDVPEEEINGAIAAIARRQNRRFDAVRDELVKGGGLTNLYLHLRDEKTLDSIIAEAEITDEPVAKTEPAAKKKATTTAKVKKKAAATKPAADEASEKKASAKKASAKETATKPKKKKAE